MKGNVLVTLSRKDINLLISAIQFCPENRLSKEMDIMEMKLTNARFGTPPTNSIDEQLR